ncbi:hypothetical protein [Brevibacillus reuszeri]|uniref:hypothetical protein n=1 Tax=Brevibacillus reuszeri TaxID=54915 RepID=UPI000CCC6E23|nr:hypothetical protein [Brevibacillus reuszeri]
MQGNITEGSPGTKASIKLTWVAPINGDGISVNGTAFFKASTGDGSTTFSTVDELVTLIDNHPLVDASLSGSTITVTYYEVGEAGNEFRVTTSNYNGFQFSAAPFLSGGTDEQTESTIFTVQTGASATGNITVKVGEVPHTVAVTAGQLPTQVAAAIAAQLTEDGVPGYSVINLPLSAIVQFTATTPNTDISPNLTVSID